MDRQYLNVPFLIKSEDIKEDGTFEGWGSLFDNNPDAHNDLVARGAFQETLAKGGRNGTGVMMGWQHDTRGMPPGVWLELREEPRGLRVKGQLALETQLGREAHEIMKLGAKTGTWRFSLSIGYDSLDEEFHTPKGNNRKVRTIKKADLWEISIVNFPAKLGATVNVVKDIKELIQQATTERELEKALRELDVFSKTDALHIISLLKTSLRDSGTKVDDAGLSLILDSLKQVNSEIRN